MSEFLACLRKELTKTQEKIVENKYKEIGLYKNVTIEIINKSFNPSLIHDVISKPAQGMCRILFASLWHTKCSKKIVTLDEFADYMRDIAAVSKSEADFEQLMETCWDLK